MKRIILCADGTWNLRDQVDSETRKRRPTNVTKTARAILPRTTGGIDQVVFYHDGLGTRGPMDKVTGGAFGSGIEDNIRNLYRSILYNYEPGDELFFFGFSRGAFTIRTLAGFMNLVGLLNQRAIGRKVRQRVIGDIQLCCLVDKKRAERRGNRQGIERRPLLRNAKCTHDAFR